MQSIDLIRENLKRSADIVLVRIEDMRKHSVVFPTPRGGCHTLWVLGHLAYIEAQVIRSFMLGESNPLADWEELFDGADTPGEIERFPPFDQVLEECRKTRASTISLLDGLTEEDLDRRSRKSRMAATNSSAPIVAVCSTLLITGSCTGGSWLMLAVPRG
jgi:DinB superfamily